jgi:hypothetical protein
MVLVVLNGDALKTGVRYPIKAAYFSTRMNAKGVSAWWEFKIL